MQKMSFGKRLGLILLFVFIAAFVTVGLLYMVVVTVSDGRPRGAGSEKVSQAKPPAAWMISQMQDSKTRADAARRIGEERAEEGVSLLRLYATDEDPAVRAACVVAMGQVGDTVSIPAVRLRIDDEDAAVRVAAVETMGHFPGDIPMAALSRAAVSLDARLRAAAARGLGRRSGSRPVAVLTKLVRDADEGVKLAAVRALSGKTEPAAVRGIAGAMNDGSADVRAAAADGLRRAGEQAMAHLARSLPASGSLAARMSAVRYLEEVGGAASVPALVAALEISPPLPPGGKSPLNSELKSRVVQALKTLGPEAVGPLEESAIKANVSIYAKRAVSEACIRFGKPAADAISRRILSWTVFPHPEELILWVTTLGEIGDASSAEALSRASLQNVPGIGDVVAVARRRIEKRIGEPLPSADGVGAGGGTAGADAGAKWIEAAKPGEIIDVRGIEQPIFFREMTVLLENALLLNRKGRNLELYLAHKPGSDGFGKWDRTVMGFAYFRDQPGKHGKSTPATYNTMDHEGTLRGVKEHGGRFRMVVEMRINDDLTVPGGEAEYVIDLKSGGRGLTGTFTGEFKGGMVQGRAAGSITAGPWPSGFAGAKPAGPAEHPRLLFRSHDLPSLRKKMETTEGTVILRRLRAMLAGQRGRQGRAPSADLWNGVGYGLLFQLTGEQRHADSAREAVDRVLAGEGESDETMYSWMNPSDKAHAGPSCAAVATAYDLCYRGWDDAYRSDLAGRIQERVYSGDGRNVKGGLVLRTGPDDDPALAAYGSWNGGAGLAVLGILGDPGTDRDTLVRCHRIFQRRAKRALLVGFTDTGYFYNGMAESREALNTGLVAYLQALQVAEGKDLVSNCGAARWALTRWLYEIVRPAGGGLPFVVRNREWAFSQFGRGSVSAGDFAQGFGICPVEHKPAVLWFYNHIIEPGPAKTFDAISYPHHAVYSFVNWPAGMADKNPAEVLPAGLVSGRGGYYAFRDKWEGPGDVVLSVGFPKARYFALGTNGFWSSGWPLETEAEITENYDDRSSVIAMERGREAVEGFTIENRSIAADFSGLSGAPALFAEVNHTRNMSEGAGRSPLAGDPGASAFVKMLQNTTGREPAKARVRPGVPPDRFNRITKRIKLGDYTLSVTTLQLGPGPSVERIGEGNKAMALVGKRTLTFDGKKIVLGKRGEEGTRPGR